MVEASASQQTVFFEGTQLPFEKLDPGRFEECVFACLVCVEKRLKLNITGTPSGSGDGGFDVEGTSTVTGRRATVQCKRQKAKLGLKLAAKELAKVAAHAALHDADVGQHLFICTGGITQELRRAVRANSRDDLVRESATALVGSDPSSVLGALKNQLAKRELNPTAVATNYVKRLESIIAWDLREFDAFLSADWNEVIDAVERYFKVASVVREHPRAVFDQTIYTRHNGDFQTVVRPRLEDSSLPVDMTGTSAAAAGTQGTPELRSMDSLDALAALEAGETALLLADGGMGKTTTLELLRSEMLRKGPEWKLPVLLRCAEYTPGHLDSHMHRCLEIDQGSWRSLPHQILLLCDGVNEISDEVARALFSELAPLLRKKRLACVFTSRTNGRIRQIVLPCRPSGCVRLQPLTPRGIHQLAQAELKETSKVRQFVAAYRSHADASRSLLMWTPFTVLWATRIWSQTQTLPSDLRELLESVLRQRIKRNAELPETQKVPISGEVILQIAHSVAFQMAVVEGRLACPLAEVGATLLKAKSRCEGALGVDELSSSDIESLLRHSEIVVRTGGGSHVGFAHQIVAGALAASHLAKNWSTSQHLLAHPAADDAWVMAARLIQPAERDKYLATIFNADVLMGARAARELPEVSQTQAADLIEQALDTRSPEALQARAVFSLAMLNSKRSIATLWAMVRTDDPDFSYIAKRALSMAGDRQLLDSIIDEVDRSRVGGIAASGGNIDVWESAPLTVKLDIAKNRVRTCPPGTVLSECLSLLAYERDPDDLPFVEIHLQAAKDASMWRPAFRAIRQISLHRAEEIFEGLHSEAGDVCARIELVDLAVQMDVDFDQEQAWRDLLEECRANCQSTESNLAAARVLKHLSEHVAQPTCVAASVEHALTTDFGSDRGKWSPRYWQLATSFGGEKIERCAVSTIKTMGDELGYACNFFIKNRESLDKHKGTLAPLLEQALSTRSRWFSWDMWRVLALTTELGFTPAAIESVISMIRALFASLRELEQAGKERGPGSYELERGVSFITESVATIHDQLPDEDIVSLLHFSLSSHRSSVEELRYATRTVPATLLDETLVSIKDPWALRSALVIVAPFGLNDIRIRLLRDQLFDTYTHLAALATVQEAILAGWSRPVLEMVIEVVVDIKVWGPYEQQFFWRFLRAISNRIEPGDLPLLETTQGTAATDFGNRVLGIWRDAANPNRVGLSRLSPSGIQEKVE